MTIQLKIENKNSPLDWEGKPSVQTKAAKVSVYEQEWNKETQKYTDPIQWNFSREYEVLAGGNVEVCLHNSNKLVITEKSI